MVAFDEEKSEAGPLLKSFASMAQTQFSKQAKVVRMDNGREFKSKPMKSFYHQRGITH